MTPKEYEAQVKTHHEKMRKLFYALILLGGFGLFLLAIFLPICYHNVNEAVARKLRETRAEQEVLQKLRELRLEEIERAGH